MLEVKNLTKKFDAVVALKNASMTIRPGEIRALLGSNGSGKSTLVKTLSGLVQPDEGEILLDGETVHIRSCADARNLKIATAYQDYSLIPAVSVAENLVLGIEPQGRFGVINQKDIWEMAAPYFTKLKINCDPKTLVQSLMPSTQSMIEIAKAMTMRPRILLLDEATASLHSDEVDTLFEVLKELKEQGMAIIIVTHRMGEIFRVCDTCSVLRGGEMVAEGNIADMNLDDIVYHMTGKHPDTTGHTLHHDDAEEAAREIVLDVKNMSVFPSVSHVDFRIHKGEIVGVGGLDGQGQSEFIRAILADTRRDDGEVIYRNRAVDFKSPAEAVRNNIGFISGNRGTESIFQIRSVGENIYVGKTARAGLFSALPPGKISGFAEDVIAAYSIVAGSVNDAASSLSGGNQQKLVIGRWLSLSPDLLLLDDPTKGVDIGSRQEIHKLIKAGAEQGMSTIYVSSDNDELLEIADRLYVFYEGKISAILSGKNIVEEKLVAAMLGLSKQEREAVS